jgi:hypothetical protein
MVHRHNPVNINCDSKAQVHVPAMNGVHAPSSSSCSCTCICISNHFFSLTDTAASASAILLQCPFLCLGHEVPYYKGILETTYVALSSVAFTRHGVPKYCTTPLICHRFLSPARHPELLCQSSKSWPPSRDPIAVAQACTRESLSCRTCCCCGPACEAASAAASWQDGDT